jgi:hypothetical protein
VSASASTIGANELDVSLVPEVGCASAASARFAEIALGRELIDHLSSDGARINTFGAVGMLFTVFR